MHDERGRELPDPTPMTMPANFRMPPTLQDEIKRLVRNELSLRAQEVGYESFEESDDFEDEDDGALPVSRHEISEMQEELPAYHIQELQKPKTEAGDAAPRPTPSPLKAASKKPVSAPQGGHNMEDPDAAEKPFPDAGA